MSAGNKVGKVVEWSVSSIVGNVAWACVYAFIVWVFNERTGCLAVVSSFASAHGTEFAAWSISSLLFGALVGALIRHRVAIRQLAAKDAEIAELRQRPTPEEIEASQSAQSALDEYDRARREARSAFRSLSARDMEFIIGLYESGARTVGEPDPIIAVLGQQGIVRKALDSPLVIDLDPKWRARIDAFRDVFDDVYSGKKGCIDR